MVQAQVARDYVGGQLGAAGADVTVEVQDWLDTSAAAGAEASFDVGYDYTCALLLIMSSPCQRHTPDMY